MKSSNYQICTKTIMDNIADPGISFNAEGVCNYWFGFKEIMAKKVIHGEEGKKKWAQYIDKIKKEGAKNKYDCIVGVSGGVDSTYIAYLVKEAKLRPLVVHFDNGWNSEIAVKNINNIIDYLDADLYSLVVDWEEFKNLQRAYIRAGVVDIEVLTDHAIFGSLYKLAAQNNIKYVISGSNVETEWLLPKAWVFDKLDSVNIQAINDKFGEMPISSYPLFTILKKKYYLNFKKLEFVAPINLQQYNKEETKKIIEKEIGWQDYGGKHHESIFTKFYQNYILPTKFNIDKRKAHLSNLICSGEITREMALEEIQKPLYDFFELENDKDYVIKKLGFTSEEFEKLMKEEPRSHRDIATEGPIENHYPILKPIKTIYRKLKR